MINPLFSNDISIPTEIYDPIGNINDFDSMRFLDERNFSVKEEMEYTNYLNNFISQLKVSNCEKMYSFFGEWKIVNPEKNPVYDYISYCLTGAEIGCGDGGTTVLSLNGPVGPWEIYDYGEYYLSTFSTMGGIAPLLLLNFVNDRLYFYTLEGSTWKLLPFHKGGEAYLKKVLPNS